jgi:hypothetical protein
MPDQHHRPDLNRSADDIDLPRPVGRSLVSVEVMSGTTTG